MPFDTRLLELLSRYEDLHQRGQPVTPEELCRECPELLAEVKRRLHGLAALQPLLGSTPAEDSAARMAAPAIPGPGDSVSPAATAAAASGRYRPLRFHAKGGLGEVVVAEDEELHREVALKRIQDGRRQDPESRRRFLLEAEITARLEHPGVVPVHGLVQDSAGQPCYAMRFIKGETLAQAIEQFHESERRPGRDPGERSLAFRQLLNRFVAVCNTVAYAHSRGILHRDLKPQNIMLGPYGETLVVDWGLAKPIARDELARAGGEETLTPTSGGGKAGTELGQAVGTPAYMSPEQAEGRWDVVGPASDIYSLGATLYALLTGEAPFQGEALAVLRQVQRGAVVPPRQRQKGVPPALEAICLKAMARQPEDRYAMALELAADVEHWLADERVGAWREPWTVQARRWLGRHRTLVTSGAAAVLVAVVSLATATVLLTAAWDSERRAKAEAEQQERAAAAQRDQAQANLDLAKKAVDDCFLLASEHPLLQREDLRRVRQLLLEKALPLYKGFQEQRQDDPVIQADLAKNYFRVAYIMNEIGRKADALDASEQARTLWEKLAAAHPEVTQYERDLATTYNNLGVLQRDTGQVAAALQAHVQARALREKLVAAHPKVTQYQSNLAATYGNLGILQRQTGQPTAALQAHQQARVLQEKLAAAHPEVTQYQSDLATTYNNLGNLQSDIGQPAAALQAHQQARALRHKLATAHPEVTQYQSDLARTYNNLGILQHETGQPAAALQAHQQARVLQEKLAAADLEVSQYQSDLATTYHNLGILQRETGQPAAALQVHEQARVLQEKLATAHPEVTQYQSDLARTYSNLGILHHETGQRAMALQAYEQAGALQHKLAAAHPEVTQYQRELAQTYNNLGVLQHETGQPTAALQAHEQARALRHKLATAHPEVTQYQSDLAQTYNNLGALQHKTGQPAGALQAYEQARTLQEQLATAHPQVTQYQIGLASTYGNLGKIASDTGKPGDGLAWYAKAIPTLQAVRQREPNHPVARQSLRTAHWGRAYALTRLSRHAEALNDWDRALELETGPGRNRLRILRACTLAHLGEHATATAEAHDLSQFKDVPGNLLYDLACVWALSSAAARKDAQLPPAEGYAARAVELLAKAQAAGFFKDRANVEHLNKDTDLNPLRQREDYQKLVQELEQKP